MLDLKPILETKHRYGWIIVFGDAGKSPEMCGRWKVDSQTDEQLTQLYEKVKNHAENWGPITGNGLVAFDFDWPWVFGLWVDHFKERVDTLIIETPNGGARVFYHTTESSPGDPFVESLHLEIKTNHYVAAGGQALTQDGDMKPYVVSQDLPIKTDNDILADTVAYLEELLETRYQWLNYHCISNHLSKCKKRIVLPHETGLALVNFMLTNGCEDWEIHNFRKAVWDLKDNKYTHEYDERKTSKQIESAHRYLDRKGKPPTCRTLLTAFNQNKDDCKGCPRKTELAKTKGKKKSKEDQALEALGAFSFKAPDDVEHLYIYREGEYIRGETFVKGFVESLFTNDTDTGLCNEVINHLKRRNYVKRSEFNKFTGEIPTLNGLLNLKTGVLSSFTPEKIFTFKIQAKYDPDTKSEKWLKFVSEILPNEDDRAALQQYAGYCLWSKMPYHRIAFLVGSGRNGKSAFLRTLADILGDDNVSNIKIDYLNGEHRFAATNLYGKLLNISSEPSTRWPLQTELLKHLSGEDWFDGEVKGVQTPIHWKPFAKHFILANKLPQVRDTSEGWWDRVLLIIFDQQFIEGKNQIQDIEDQWLSDDADRSAILNWLIEGWVTLNTQRKFTQSRSQNEAMIQFKKNSDPVSAFLIEQCTYETSAFLLREELYVAYKSYAQSLNATIEGDKAFYAKVRLQPGVRDGDKRVTGKIKRVFYGLRLKTEDDEETEQFESREEEDVNMKGGGVAHDALPTSRQTFFDEEGEKNKKEIRGYEDVRQVQHVRQPENELLPSLDIIAKGLQEHQGTTSSDLASGLGIPEEKVRLGLKALQREGRVFESVGDRWRWQG